MGFNRDSIVFELEQDEDGYPPHQFELLQGERLESGNYRIAETPFFAIGIALDDIVSVMAGDLSPKHAAGIVSCSGLISISIIAHDREACAQIDALINACRDEIEQSRHRQLRTDFSIYGLALRPEVYTSKLKPQFEAMEASCKFSFAELAIRGD